MADAQTKEQALDELKKSVYEVLSWTKGNEQKIKEIGFREFAKTYLDDYIRVTRRNFNSDVSRLKKLTEHFKDVELREITPMMIEQFKKSRLKAGNAKSTCNRYLALMKKMFNMAIEEGYLEENAVSKVKLYSEHDNLRERILTEKEQERLIRSCSEAIRPIVVVALNSGMRIGEILSLRWNQIDFASNRIRVEKTKSDRVRFVPINSVLREELECLRSKNGHEPYLFFNAQTQKPILRMDKSFKSACRRAEIEGLRFHDLRHTFASRLIEKGADIETVKELLGHYSIITTQRYTHSGDERKRKAVELLSKPKKKGGTSDTRLTHGEEEPKNEIFEKPIRCLFSMN